MTSGVGLDSASSAICAGAEAFRTGIEADSGWALKQAASQERLPAWCGWQQQDWLRTVLE